MSHVLRDPSTRGLGFQRSLCTGGLDPRDLNIARFCISFLRKGEVMAYVGRIHNLKDLKDLMLGFRRALMLGFWRSLITPHRATLYLLYTSLCTGELNAIRKHNCFLCSPF